MLAITLAQALPWVTAAAAVTGLAFREWQNRQVRIEQQVKTAVDASYGSLMRDFRDAETEMQRQLDESSSAARTATAEIQRLLESTKDDTRRLEALLERVHGLLPEVERASLTLPSTLLVAAQTGTVSERLGALTTMLDTPGADGDEIYVAAELASRLGARNLAMQLLRRSRDMNPEHRKVQSSLLSLEARTGLLKRQEALQLAREQVLATPLERDVVSDCLNVYTYFDDYDGMRQLADDALDVVPDGSRTRSLLLRNRAVALRETGAPKSEVTDAYRAALAVASGTGEFVNNARPYLSFLINEGELDSADDVLRQALRREPDSLGLLALACRLFSLRNQIDLAGHMYNRLNRLAPQSLERAQAEGYVTKSLHLDELRAMGILSDTDEPEFDDGM